MMGLGKIGVVSCFLLGATAWGIAAPVVADASDPAATETGLPPPASSPPDRSAPDREQAPNGNPLWGIPIKQLSATRDRPIFSPSRRPPPPAMVDQPIVAATPTIQRPPEPERPQLSLLGTVVNGDNGFGIFMDQATKTPLRIRIGATYQGWMLRSLKPGSVTLVKGQDSAVLAFPQPVTDQAAPARPVASPPPRKPRRQSTGQTTALNPSQSTSIRAQARNLGDPNPLEQ